MNKSFAFSLAALAIAACSEQADFTQADIANAAIENANAGDVPVAFGTYLGTSGTTRAGAKGEIANTNTLEAAATGGFGVFAYAKSSTISNTDALGVPNFMYNQQVTHGTDWTYTPVKYWPNGIDAANQTGSPSSTATESAAQYLNFFAYAPYVYVTESTGVEKTTTEETNQKGANGQGITAITPNSGDNGTVNGASDSKNHPLIHYTISTTPSAPTSVVDLLWGIRGQLSYAETDGVNNTVGALGNVYNLNLTKQTTTERVKFLFKHALAKIGGNNGLKVVYDLDGNSTTPETGFGTTDANTLVTLKSVTIKNALINGTSTIIPSGKFDIAEGKWVEWGTPSATTQSSLSYIVSTTENAMNAEIAEPSSPPTYSTSTSTWSPVGVTTAAKNVCGTATTNPVFLIPGKAGQVLEVTVEYVVRTYDSKLNDAANDDTGTGKPWTKITQTITNNVELPILDVNKYYTLVLHLGLTTVKFSAEVGDWDTAESTESKVIWLPSNVVTAVNQVIAWTNSGTATGSISKDAGTYTINLTGLTPGTTITPSSSSAGYNSATTTTTYMNSGSSVGSDGKATVSISYDANDGESRNIVVTLTSSADTNPTMTLTLTQAAGS